MSTYEWYLFGHLLGVFFLLAAAGASTAAGIVAGRTNSAAVVVTLLDLQRRSELYITSLGAILVIVFGSLLVDEADFEFGDAWISAAYTLIIISLAIDHGFLMPRVRRARQAAAALGPNAQVTDEVRSMLNNPVMVGAGVLLDLLLIVFLWLMVAKPGA